MGTPEFARTTLAFLSESKHEVLAVVTGPDRKTGRGRKLIPTACSREAERRALTVYKPGSLKDDGLYESLRALDPDLFVVLAFRILPERLFALPRYGSINIHASLLPRYRGAAPINWALINGETETGLTSFFLKATVDTGNMILQERIPIYEDDSYDTLAARMGKLSGPFTLKTIDLIESGDYVPLPQDESLASWAPKISPFDAMIDFGFPAQRVRDFVRGMSTRPGAYTYFRGKKIKVHACSVVDTVNETNTRPGTVLGVNKRLLVQCDHSVIELVRLVPEGRAEMDGLSFINGYRPQLGELFGEIVKGVEE